MKINKQMIDWFRIRTNNHISLVKKYCDKISKFKGFSDLSVQCQNHDASKFCDPEYVPYILISWQYKCKSDGIEFNVSDYWKDLMNSATEHHVKQNSHHPEFYSNETNVINTENRDKPAKLIDATKMPLMNVAEMVADWCAVSKERHTNPKDWADSNIGTRWKFDDKQTKLIYDLIAKIF